MTRYQSIIRKKANAIEVLSNSLAWEKTFPPVYGHTSISFLKSRPGFEDAKRGDLPAAINVVESCVKPERIAELREKYPEAVLLPVITDNKLPEALARKIGMKTYIGAYAMGAVSRKDLPAMERLTNKPRFGGQISKGVSYIIVDDVVTQGGTISALRKHVKLCGGTVAAVAALAFSTDSRVIVPARPDVRELIDRFTYAFIMDLLREYNIADDIWELTRQEVRYLLCFKRLENIVERLSVHPPTFYSN